MISFLTLVCLFLSACGTEADLLLEESYALHDDTELATDLVATQGAQSKNKKKYRKSRFKKVIATPTRMLEMKKLSLRKRIFRVKDQDNNISSMF